MQALSVSRTQALCTKDIALEMSFTRERRENQTGGRGRKSILSDALEAVIGAIYLDGGFANAKEFIHKYILTDIEHKQLFYDSKTILQEVVQGEHEQLTYVLTDESVRIIIRVLRFVHVESVSLAVEPDIPKKQRNRRLRIRHF